VVCNYGTEFLAAFEYGNICGTQFHPEKSQTNGLVLLKNFLSKK
jgi:glutamine amidotransferase